MMRKIAGIVFLLVAVIAEEQGRQLNWNALSFLTKPGYANLGQGSGDLHAAAATLNAQGKAAANYQNLPQQSLVNNEGAENRDSYSAPAPAASSYSAPSSPAGGDYHVEADSSYGYSSGGGGGGYGDDKLGTFVHALTAFLPIGLFLAAIVPNVITVNTGRRKRSEQTESVDEQITYPVLDMISSYGFRSLQEPVCQSKVACEIGSLGGLPDANGVQRALWLTANFVPERVARVLGVDGLFRSIRSRRCVDYTCKAK